jgi:hypothetical protein
MAVLLGIFCLAGCSETNIAHNWREFKSEKGKFSAQFPGRVHVDDVGTIAQFEADGQQANFRITCSEVPALQDKNAALRELHTMRDGTAASLGGTVEEARNAEFQGQPAIEFTLTYSLEGANMISHSKYIRGRNCFYQLIVTAPAGIDVEQDARRFFESFKTTN